jgi:hypothetical protein
VEIAGPLLAGQPQSAEQTAEYYLNEYKYLGTMLK